MPAALADHEGANYDSLQQISNILRSKYKWPYGRNMLQRA